MSQQTSTALLSTSTTTSSSSSVVRTAALRAEIELELHNKKQCAYKPYECTRLAMDYYNYCNQHILEDKCAPFKQCSYVYVNNGKRCHLPAPKSEKKETSYCNEHALKSHMLRTRQASRYLAPPTPEVLLHSLNHYVKKSRSRTTSNSTQSSDDCNQMVQDETDAKVTKYLDPFREINVQQVNQSSIDVLDLCSESESDVEPSYYSTVWQDSHADTSDNESLDSEQEDLLKHANVYTAEEITQLTREKLIKLQSLYIDQYRHLQYLLREKRRKYLYNLKREKETYCSIQNQVKDNPKEMRLYKKLKAYNAYHRKNGVDAILSKRVHELRAKITNGMTPKPSSYAKCSYVEDGVKCGERVLPAARHCRRHILEDPNQVLFRACGKVKSEIECKTPIESVFEDATCPLHMEMPPIRSYAHVRKDSESDFDEPMDEKNLNNDDDDGGNLSISDLQSTKINVDSNEVSSNDTNERQTSSFPISDCFNNNVIAVTTTTTTAATVVDAANNLVEKDETVVKEEQIEVQQKEEDDADNKQDGVTVMKGKTFICKELDIGEKKHESMVAGAGGGRSCGTTRKKRAEER